MSKKQRLARNQLLLSFQAVLVCDTGPATENYEAVISNLSVIDGRLWIRLLFDPEAYALKAPVRILGTRLWDESGLFDVGFALSGKTVSPESFYETTIHFSISGRPRR